MPGVGFPRSPQDTRKTQDTPIPAVLGKTLTDYCPPEIFPQKIFLLLENDSTRLYVSSGFLSQKSMLEGNRNGWDPV